MVGSGRPVNKDKLKNTVGKMQNEVIILLITNVHIPVKENELETCYSKALLILLDLKASHTSDIDLLGES